LYPFYQRPVIIKGRSILKGVVEMRKVMAFIFGAVLGGVLGGLTALLLAPYSGDDLRSVIRKNVGEIQIEIKEAAQKKREELEAQLQEMINPPES
jgi:gas vesicle protein